MNLVTRVFKFLQTMNVKIIRNSWSGVNIHKKNQSYTDFFYNVMEHDEIRNQAYQKVIRDKVKDKVVVEIGTGKALFLTKMCIDYGARSVYTIEVNKQAFESSQKLIQHLGLQQQINIYHGFSTDVQLEVKGDVFLHEIIGVIGSDEGIVQATDDAKKRFLKPDAQFIPYRCQSLLCPVSSLSVTLKDKFINFLLKRIGVSSIYHKNLQVNNSYTIYNFPLDHIIADPEIVEDIIFHAPLSTQNEQLIEWHISDPVNFSGFIFFIQLFIDEKNILNSLEQKLNWPILYVKLLSEDITLIKGDRLVAKISIDVSTEQPIYTINSHILRDNRIIFQNENFIIR